VSGIVEAKVIAVKWIANCITENEMCSSAKHNMIESIRKRQEYKVFFFL